jgi:hypothetical protein
MMNNLPKPEIVATEFSKVLRTWLTPAEMSEVVSRNSQQQDPNICHSHDFCDANMAMDEALQSFGVDITAEGGLQDDNLIDLWNASWGIAKAREFLV